MNYVPIGSVRRECLEHAVALGPEVTERSAGTYETVRKVGGSLRSGVEPAASREMGEAGCSGGSWWRCPARLVPSRCTRCRPAAAGVIPDRVTTDGHDAYPRAIRMELGSRARHRTSAISTIASSRIIVASRADVDRCSASRASHQQDDTAAVTTNSGTSSALE